MSVGMPAALHLEEFGAHIYAAFGHVPYRVGSSLKLKTGWRDVDVRLILPDDEYAAMFGAETNHTNEHQNEKWVAFVLAFSAFGKSVTGLPIDFQIQRRTDANEKLSKDDDPRSAFGIFRHLGCSRAEERASSPSPSSVPKDTTEGKES